MQLSGPGIFGPPKDRDAALAVLREAVAFGVNHIDTSDYYGPYITNQLIREALHPYPNDLVIVTKIGARRGSDGSVLAASSLGELIQAVHDNLRNLDVDVLEVVNLRNMFDDAARAGEFRLVVNPTVGGGGRIWSTSLALRGFLAPLSARSADALTV
jgi:pyridoxine 4-dehydrogenase